MSHPYPIHGVAFATTGVPTIDVGMAAFRPPIRGTSRISGRRWNTCSVAGVGLLPVRSTRFSCRFPSAASGRTSRFAPARTGVTWDRLQPEMDRVHRRGGRSSSIRGGPGSSFDGKEPYLGCTARKPFPHVGHGRAAGMSLDRLSRRRSLVEQFDQPPRPRTIAGRGSLCAFSRRPTRCSRRPSCRRRWTSGTKKRRPDRVRMTLFGQSCLAARRLIEAGRGSSPSSGTSTAWRATRGTRTSITSPE